ncbi:uncharacterized protein BCR38DRAFT_479672 [Pseudomassariella vexata]|uniref:SnoaL-like domain-containing protein n=1 Tax=Pseudomassariella vexata TaxID=1141098 RepID=A0A1Y2EHX0_9PEZI|nr:uncharacterized protein BCR38DRAFT_479672 [Pseudomassariella vexata]ORY71153.1 hypothetical protein BCR38DRAFT_479672 [Pseudomassariella vexata]
MISTSVQKVNHETGAARTTLLRTHAHAFCQSLLSAPPPRELLSQHFIPDSKDRKPTIFEHGPSWATSRLPFLGREFIGVDECEKYFTVLSETLKMKLSKGSFPSVDGFVVDAEKNEVCVVGKGRFESVSTGRSWEEQFSYVLGGWDEQGKLGNWHIWADPLSAWVALGEEDIEGWGKGEHRSLGM